MAIYAIGDIQGCYNELNRLLEQLKFDQAADTLWFAGDLVNRGPDSLQVLRLVHSLGEAAVTVLGNHDFHLLAQWQQVTEQFTPSPLLQAVLEAPDCELLLQWLRRRPLLHHDARLGYTLVHAGLAPPWSLDRAAALAQEVAQQLRSDSFADLLHHLYGNEPRYWSESLSGWERLRFIVNALTRIRFCDHQGGLDFKQKVGIRSHHPDLLPWFSHPQRRSATERVIFGHWSTLKLYRHHHVYGIDTGCLWGGELTAMRLDTPQPQFIRLQCQGAVNPSNYLPDSS
ncbi:symmetrical bis(5'-nucleosyl)-tetraphosphatase [Ectothiorhodospiraceae bacterium BW-2]|nr:symmetrical bis(5'-nucleosyl)-tetraphosphatase [Ectothiorhodospiraceae bacterium BW-2]